MNNIDLNSLLKKANLALRNDVSPTVILDLDDTLFDSRSRTLRILNEFSQKHLEDLEVKDLITQVKLDAIEYRLEDTLVALNISDICPIKLKSFWLKRFFSSEYAALDDLLPGAAELVSLFKMNNIEVFYLTGRSHKMRQGTLSSLKNRGLYLASDQHLVTKEDPKEDDLIYKKNVGLDFQKRQDLQVIGFFENQPENANQFATLFPNANHFLLDTIHAPTNEGLSPKIKKIKNFIVSKTDDFS